jgi:predicted nucleic acid-binding protein
MIILDTNVISEQSKPAANARVISWLNRQLEESLFLTAINMAELLKGVVVLPEGKRKEIVRVAVDAAIASFVHPVLPFDEAAAMAHSDILIRAKKNRYTLPVADGLIAAIAEVHGFAVATRDVAPFVAAGVPVINPWEEISR